MFPGWGWGRQRPQQGLWRGWAPRVILSAPLVPWPLLGPCLSRHEGFALQEELKLQTGHQGAETAVVRGFGGLCLRGCLLPRSQFAERAFSFSVCPWKTKVSLQ